MPLRPKMRSIWDEFFPSEADYCDSNIEEVFFNSEVLDNYNSPSRAVGTLEILIEIFPFNKDDSQGPTIRKKITAKGAYVFDFPAREFVVGQMLKNLSIYADIVRFDIVTTGSLLRFECDSYTIEVVS